MCVGKSRALNAPPPPYHLDDEQARMMSDTTATDEAEVEAAPKGELTELARLEIRIGKIVEVRRWARETG